MKTSRRYPSSKPGFELGLKIAIAQMNPTVGDYPANTARVLRSELRAAEAVGTSA